MRYSKSDPVFLQKKGGGVGDGTGMQCMPERWVLKKSLQNYLVRKFEEEKK